jgi:hypothetical protein
MFGEIIGAVTAVGAAALGAAFAWRLQTRVLLRRERSAAAALLQDLERLEREVPRLDDGVAPTPETRRHRTALEAWNAEPDVVPSYPTMHPWIQPLIVELAARDAPVVGYCMRIETILKRHESRLAAAVSTRATLNRGLDEIKRYENAIADPDHARNIATHTDALAASRRSHEGDVARYERAAEEWRAIDRELVQVIDATRSRLSAIVSLPVPEQPWLSSIEMDARERLNP